MLYLCLIDTLKMHQSLIFVTNEDDHRLSFDPYLSTLHRPCLKRGCSGNRDFIAPK